MTKLTVTQRYTGESLAELNMHTASEVKAMIARADNLHQKGELPAFRRIEILQNLAELIKAEHEDFAKLIANEGGKPIKDARVEVTRAIDGIRIALAEIQNIKGEQVPMDLTAAGAGRMAFTIMEPIGIVVAVSAFNHPLNLIIHQVIPAVATGCPVIVKPASSTPLCCLRVAELLEQAGLPEAWVQVALVDNENASKLVTHKKIAFFSFIGSARVGWMLKSKLSPGVRCALEHGGVAPLIYDEFSDHNKFINGVVKAGLYHAGQVCVSVQKVFVPEAKAQSIAQEIALVASKQVVGDAINEDTDIGPLISTKELERVEAWVNEAVAEGATLITGGKRINNVSFEPTVLLNPSPDSKVSSQEIFGPVICIYSYSDIEQAIASANSLDVAFQTSVFSDDVTKALNIATRLNASAVMINDFTTFRVDWMPFAGRKHSGYGIGGIGYTMHDMLEHKMIALSLG